MINVPQVQQAACSAFATLEEDAGSRLLPYLSHVLPYMAEAMDRYQTRSLIVLFDTLGTLADSVKHELATQEHVAVFLPKVGRYYFMYRCTSSLEFNCHVYTTAME